MIHYDQPATLLEALELSRDGATRHAPGEVAPVAILWTDADGEWLPLIPLLRERWPGLLTFGDFDAAKRQGPAVWLRCVIERTLPEYALPEGVTPVIYLPNIPRTALRAGDECPEPVRPLVELQYRGAVWCQRNGRDWTVEAMLVSEDTGLELDVARDERTRRALLGSLAQLAVTPVARLRGQRLEAADFDKLMIEDTPRELLTWLSDPQATRARWDDEDKAKWPAFCSRCRAEYDFDPDKDGEVVAGEKLGLRQDEWAGVWERFAEAPAIYGGVPSLLRRAKPATLIFDKESWPDENEAAEKSLRAELLAAGAMPAAAARTKIAELDKQHAARRGWVWARMGGAPLALALESLASLARQSAQSIGGDTLEAMAAQYVQEGWQVDDTALRASGSVKSNEDAQAVTAAVRAIYLPWLDDTATHFQKLVAAMPLPTSRKATVPMAGEGECLLFADGLRFDLGRRLAHLAEQRRCHVTASRRWAATPSVTATAKPAVTPVGGKIEGHRLGEKFEPDITATGQPANTDRLRKLMEAEGYQVLGSGDTGKPVPTARGWAEIWRGGPSRARIAGRSRRPDRWAACAAVGANLRSSPGWVETRAGRDRSRVASLAGRAAVRSIAALPCGKPLGTLRDDQGNESGRRPYCELVLESCRGVCFRPWRELFRCRQRVCTRRDEPAGVLGAGANLCAKRNGGGDGCGHH